MVCDAAAVAACSASRLKKALLSFGVGSISTLPVTATLWNVKLSEQHGEQAVLGPQYAVRYEAAIAWTKCSVKMQ